MKKTFPFYFYYIILTSFLFLISCTKKDNSPSNNNPQNEDDANANKLQVGASANDLLSGNNYNELIIEIISVKDFELSNSVISSFKSFIEERLNKPQGVTIINTAVESPGISPYSTQEIIDYEESKRTKFNNDKKIAVYIFISDGSYTENNVLGLAYRNTSFAIMGGRIRELTGGIGQPSEDLVLQSVIRHEMSHILGLVNVGTNMQTPHQDQEHGHHCNDKDCLMYYAIENGDFLNNLIGNSSPPSLDSQCLADLKANGGK